MTNTNLTKATSNLVADLRLLIEDAKTKVATVANAGITMLYWHIGERINREILGYKRAEYGKRIVSTVSTQLQDEYGGQEFSTRNIRRMMQFASLFPDIQIVSTLMSQLSWSHFIEILPLKEGIQREFYLTMAAEERWGVRTLRAKIDGMLFERTAISEKPEDQIRTELIAIRNERKISPDMVFKSPYFLEFTGLKGGYTEESLENTLISHIEQFLLELGDGFTFVARQKRMIIDGEDFHLDLLFFHRKLHRLIAIDLKLGRFKAQYKGQMELYLRWLERYEMQPGEESPLGLILCTEGSREQIELLQLDSTGIKVGQYMTELPPKNVLIRQLQRTITSYELSEDSNKTK
ncbi:MAG: PDDEXK nuclease domain-containing protein [Muribaculaceae bacterium]|nr:PDDEXK nuclease domain-containing protein [Muribaculaceae bacterium]